MSTSADASGFLSAASIEYLLIGLALCLVLFHGEPSAMKKILVAIQQNYSHFSYAMSLP